MDIKNKRDKMPGHEEHLGLEFDVMSPVEPKAAPPQPSKPTLTPPIPRRAGDRTLTMILVAVIILLVLGGGGYLAYSYFLSGPEDLGDSSLVSDIDVPDAGDQSPIDTDSDGLSDEDEARAGTKPDEADTDGDGLSDGDEVNVYKSDPLLFDTDGDGFDDGEEVAKGYSPIVASSEKADSSEVEGWEARILEFGLHEPTQSTLLLNKASSEIQPAEAQEYGNEVYGYNLSVPKLLSWRENSDKSQVGFYVTGTTPEPEINLDPIYVNIAVKDQDQTLGEWIESIYQKGRDYSSFESVNNSASVIRMHGVIVNTTECPSELTLFDRGNLIVMMTLSCNKSKDFVDLYNGMMESAAFN